MVPAAFPMYNPSMAAAYGPFGGAFPTNMSSTQQPTSVASQKQVDDLEAKVDTLARNSKTIAMTTGATAEYAAGLAEKVAGSVGVGFKRPALAMSSSALLKTLDMTDTKKIKAICNYKPKTREGQQAYDDVMDSFKGDSSVNSELLEQMASESAMKVDQESAAAGGAANGAAGGVNDVHLELFMKREALSNPIIRKNLMEQENGKQTAAGMKKLQTQFKDNNTLFGFGYCEWADNPFIDPDQATKDAWYAFKAANNFPARDDWDGVSSV